MKISAEAYYGIQKKLRENPERYWTKEKRYELAQEMDDSLLASLVPDAETVDVDLKRWIGLAQNLRTTSAAIKALRLYWGNGRR